MKAYPIELRDRVVARVVGGASVRSVADLFSVGAATVVRWSQRFRLTGSAAPILRAAARGSRLDPERDWILSQFAERPDLTIEELRHSLASRGVVVSYGGLWNFIHKSGLSFKKKYPSQ